jgi:hypothetical protein
MPTLTIELSRLDIEPIEVVSPPATPELDLAQLTSGSIAADRLPTLPLASSSCVCCETCCCCGGGPHPE